jgi:[acyl-carrier-protein] S-malonyltransferase
MNANGVTRIVEAGSGKVLSGLAKRIVKELDAVSIGSPADLETNVANLV